jgi:hypothetical protein
MHPLWVRVVLIVSLIFAVPGAAAGSPATQSTRFFSETGFGITNDQFLDYFQKRGGVKTFGFPVSRETTLLGFPVQFFQRGIMQLNNGTVRTLNLLDADYLPYTTINGSTFPGVDAEVVRNTPPPSQADKVIEYMRQVSPDEWEGKPVRFFATFNNTVTYDMAFPRGEGPRGLMPLINLEIWGAPTSKPTRDPNNHNFVYQRFQRGIMHYDDACKCTQGLLLADYLKSVITGDNLPADLGAQAAGSPFFKIYRESAGDGLARSGTPKDTNLKQAFQKHTASDVVASAPVPPAPAPVAAPAPPQQSSAPQPTAAPKPSQPQPSSGGGRTSTGGATSPDYGMNIFLWGHQSTTERDLRKVADAQFGWQKTLFQWRLIQPSRNTWDWDEADRIVRASKDTGVKIIARLDFQPDWARAAKVHNGPPDRYEDFYTFVGRLVERYNSSSRIGRIHAIEIWNEPNIDREWGDARIDQAQAQDYVRLLKGSYEAAKAADPSVVVITAGMSPTCTDNNNARPDDVYVQWILRRPGGARGWLRQAAQRIAGGVGRQAQWVSSLHLPPRRGLARRHGAEWRPRQTDLAARVWVDQRPDTSRLRLVPCFRGDKGRLSRSSV